MCKCISNIIKKQLKGKSRTGKQVVMFEFTEAAAGEFFSFKTGRSKGYKTKSDVKYRLEGQKKINTTYMIHNFCPFCGVAYK